MMELWARASPRPAPLTTSCAETTVLVRHRFGCPLANFEGVMGQPQENKRALRSLEAKRRRFLAVGRSPASALQGHGVPEGATSDNHFVLKEPLPPHLNTRIIEPQGEPPPEVDSEWNFNLESLEAPLTLPPVPAGWSIFEALPSEEARPTALGERCINLHRLDVVG